MSVFAKFMLRRGWIQLSQYGLEIGSDGEVRKLILASPAPPAHNETPLMKQAPLVPTIPAQAALPLARDVDDAAKDEKLWQAAMDRAKARIDESPGIEEDWDALIAKAKARASESSDAEEELSDFVPTATSAQVGQDAIPANDDMPADLVTSIHHKRLSSPSVVARDVRDKELGRVPANSKDLKRVPGIESFASDDDDWQKLKADAEKRARVEVERREQAIREVRRLQKNSIRPRRLAEGTTNIPHTARSSARPPAIPFLKRAKPAKPASAVGESPLPRMTERFS